jgi:hypothetical protein
MCNHFILPVFFSCGFLPTDIDINEWKDKSVFGANQAKEFEPYKGPVETEL